jgi:hypothetical protein
MITIADGIGLLIGIVVIATLADRLRIAYPILLVIAGIGVALIPTSTVSSSNRNWCCWSSCHR